jgi:hypothetical protein
MLGRRCTPLPVCQAPGGASICCAISNAFIQSEGFGTSGDAASASAAFASEAFTAENSAGFASVEGVRQRMIKLGSPPGEDRMRCSSPTLVLRDPGVYA